MVPAVPGFLLDSSMSAEVDWKIQMVAADILDNMNADVDGKAYNIDGGLQGGHSALELELGCNKNLFGQSNHGMMLGLVDELERENSCHTIVADACSPENKTLVASGGKKIHMMLAAASKQLVANYSHILN